MVSDGMWRRRVDAQAYKFVVVFLSLRSNFLKFIESINFIFYVLELIEFFKIFNFLKIIFFCFNFNF